MGGESDQDRSEDSDDKNLLDDGHIRIEGAESPEVFVTDERNQSVRRSKRKVVETDSIEIDDEATDANVEANEAYAEELSTSPLSVIDDPLNEVSTKSQIRMKSEKKGPLEVAVNLEESESVESEITEIRVIRRKGKPTKTKRQLATLRLEEEEESMKDSNVSPTLTIPKSFEPVKSIRKKGNPAKDPRISYSSTTDDRLANDRDGTNPPQEDVSTLGQIYKTIKGLVVKPQVDEVPIRSFRKKGRATLHQESETNGDEHEATDDKEAEEPINVAVLPRKAAKLRSTAIPNYKKAEITNRADFKIRAVLDEADRLLVEVIGI